MLNDTVARVYLESLVRTQETARNRPFADRFRVARSRLGFSYYHWNALYALITYNKSLKPALVKAELAGFNLYSLRHTHATLLLANGENAKVASERLGHSTIVLTLGTYSHVLPAMQQGAADRIETLLFKTGT